MDTLVQKDDFMKETEKAYIAGIIDGEGSIMLIRFKANQQPAPCVSVASNTIELLQWIKDTSGLGRIKSKKNYDAHHHANSFTYEVKYNDAIQLLEWISPYLRINSKQKRAQLIINNYKDLTPRNGRYTEEQLTRKEDFYNTFIAIK